jgi:hypothetical protein
MLVAVDAANEPRVVYSDTTLTAALKSVAWSQSSSGLFLFASGARETIRACKVDAAVSWKVDVAASSSSSVARKEGEGEVEVSGAGKAEEREVEVELQVLPWGGAARR